MATINTRKRRKEQVCVFRSEKKYVSVQTSAKLKILCNQIKILMDFMFGSILDVEKKNCSMFILFVRGVTVKRVSIVNKPTRNI